MIIKTEKIFIIANELETCYGNLMNPHHRKSTIMRTYVKHAIVIDICTSLKDFKNIIHSEGNQVKGFEELSKNIKCDSSGIVYYFISKAANGDSEYCNQWDKQFYHPEKPWYDFSGTLLDLFYCYVHNTIKTFATPKNASESLPWFPKGMFTTKGAINWKEDFFDELQKTYEYQPFVHTNVPIAMSSFIATICPKHFQIPQVPKSGNDKMEKQPRDIANIYFPMDMNDIQKEAAEILDMMKHNNKAESASTSKDMNTNAQNGGDASNTIATNTITTNTSKFQWQKIY